jgi:hypothetical protein
MKVSVAVMSSAIGSISLREDLRERFVGLSSSSTPVVVGAALMLSEDRIMVCSEETWFWGSRRGIPRLDRGLEHNQFMLS